MARLLSRRHGVRGALSQASQFHARERRRAADEFSRYREVIETPFFLGTISTGLALPGDVAVQGSLNIGVAFSVAVAAGAVTFDYRGRTLTIPALAADQIHDAGYFERNSSLTNIISSTIGSVLFYALDEWRRPFLIAGGDFT